MGRTRHAHTHQTLNPNFSEVSPSEKETSLRIPQDLAGSATPEQDQYEKKEKESSITVKIVSALALFPLLYFIYTGVTRPLSQSIGKGLVHIIKPDQTRITTTTASDGLHYLSKRVDKHSGEYVAFIVLIPVLVILSGIFAGLTLGYMSLDMTQLTILASSGTPKQKELALKIIPVRKNGHLLLTTLLLVNMIVNETLPIISDPVLGGGVEAVVVSTVLIIIFSEIIPQSICSRYGLVIGAKAAFMTQCLIYVMYPIGRPVAWILEKLLGNHNGIIYRKNELRELLNLHRTGGHAGGDLLNDTIGIAQGALDLQDKVVRDAMTPISEVFMLEDTTKLDYEVLSSVVQSGHSRIPVYKVIDAPDLERPGKTRKIKRILGIILVKSFVLLDPEDATPIMSVPFNMHFPSVPQDEPLLNMLNAFQEGRSHLAVVSRRTRRVVLPIAGDDDESIINAAALGLKDRIWKSLHLHDSSSDDEDVELGNVSSSKDNEDKKKRKQQKKNRLEDERKEQLKQGQSVPADAIMSPTRVEEFISDVEGESIGIITIEDVLEELIGEEIADEYDQHDKEGHATAAFIPQEAIEAISKAQQDRAMSALSEKADDDENHKEKPQITALAEPIPKRTVTASFASLQSKLGGIAIRRTSSAPGRKRTALPLEEGLVTNATPPASTTPIATHTSLPPADADESNAALTLIDESSDNGKTISQATDVGEDEAKMKGSPAVDGQIALPPSAEPVVDNTPGINTPRVAAGLPLSTPHPALLAEALERGRKRAPGALLATGLAQARSQSIPVSGVSTPVPTGIGFSGTASKKKLPFKSTPGTLG